MKKTILSFIMLTNIGIYSSQAQITVNSTDVVGSGDVVEQAHDTIPGTITIGTGGANQTWNFSALSEDGLDTTFFKNPTPLPGSSNFLSSNLGMEDTAQDSSWIFVSKNSSGFFIDGMTQYNNGNLMVIPIASTIITFPSTMGTSFNGLWNGTLATFPMGQDPDGPLGPHGTVDSLKVTRQATINSNIDGWGNVTTPFGTFPSLRQIVNEENVDTTWQLVGGNWQIISSTTITFLGLLGVTVNDITYDTTRTARWWTNDPTAKFPVVEIDYEANGTVNNVDWQKSSPTVSVNEQANTTAQVLLYPNPAKDKITIETGMTNNNSISILDVTGRLVFDNEFNANKITFSVTDLDNGVYFYNIYDVKGNVLYSNKFIVAK